jgi:hypothetical protein
VQAHDVGLPGDLVEVVAEARELADGGKSWSLVLEKLRAPAFVERRDDGADDARGGQGPTGRVGHQAGVDVIAEACVDAARCWCPIVGDPLPVAARGHGGCFRWACGAAAQRCSRSVMADHFVGYHTPRHRLLTFHFDSLLEQAGCLGIHHISLELLRKNLLCERASCAQSSLRRFYFGRGSAPAPRSTDKLRAQIVYRAATLISHCLTIVRHRINISP